MRLTNAQLRTARQLLKDKQDQLEPRLTFSIMRETLGYTSNSPVQNIVEKLVELGWMEEYDLGDKKGYRVIE